MAGSWSVAEVTAPTGLGFGGRSGHAWTDLQTTVKGLTAYCERRTIGLEGKGPP